MRAPFIRRPLAASTISVRFSCSIRLAVACPMPSPLCRIAVSCPKRSVPDARSQYAGKPVQECFSGGHWCIGRKGTGDRPLPGTGDRDRAVQLLTEMELSAKQNPNSRRKQYFRSQRARKPPERWCPGGLVNFCENKVRGGCNRQLYIVIVGPLVICGGGM